MALACDKIVYTNINTMTSSRRNKTLERRWRTFSTVFTICVYMLCIFCDVKSEEISERNVNWYQYSTDPPSQSSLSVTELTNGLITKRQRLEKSLSPFIVRDDIVIEREGELVIEPGVELRFAPQVGITVRGVLTAKVIYSFILS